MGSWRIGLAGCLALLASFAFASAASAVVVTNSAPIEFGASGPNNGSVYPSTVTVNDPGTVTDVNVTLHDFSHMFPDDVSIVLVGPQGQAFLLQSGAGSDANVNDVTYTLDDEAAGRLPNNGTWGDGSYRPAAYYEADSFPGPGPGLAYTKPGPAYGTATFLSVFGGTEAAGNWKLYTRDFVTGDGGSIAGGWSLDVKLSGTEPETTLDSGPPSISNSASASFAFSADRSGSFECKLDGGPFEACASPQSYSGLSDGPHQFQVRALDIRNLADTSPATQAWTIDTTAPNATIDSGPSGTIEQRDVSFAFSADEAADFLCKLDDAPFTACSSPVDYSGLADGPHTFALRATDAAGNVDQTGATRSFAVRPATSTDPVDRNDPVVALTKRKLRSRHGKQRAIIARFSGNDDLTPSDALTFTCQLDGGAPAACTSPTTFSKLSFGRHTLSVVATDQAGKTSRPAVKTFQFRKRKPRP